MSGNRYSQVYQNRITAVFSTESWKTLMMYLNYWKTAAANWKYYTQENCVPLLVEEENIPLEEYDKGTCNP